MPLPASDLAFVNDHIDLCINQEAINQASRSSSPPARTARKPTSGPSRPAGVAPASHTNGPPRKKVRAEPPAPAMPPPKRIKGAPSKTSKAAGKKTNPYVVLCAASSARL